MEPKALPGTPWEGEISLGNFSGGPPEDNNDFFSAPGASGSALGASRGASSSPVGAQDPEASKSHFGTIWGAKMEPRGLIFGTF